jgi:glycylpeptide N-tetradecanoyltransferase
MSVELTDKEMQSMPYNLPSGFAWVSFDIQNPVHLDEIYHLLSNHYVTDDKFRLCYDKEFLKWALSPPEYVQNLHLGVKCGSN